MLDCCGCACMGQAGSTRFTFTSSWYIFVAGNTSCHVSRNLNIWDLIFSSTCGKQTLVQRIHFDIITNQTAIFLTMNNSNFTKASPMVYGKKVHDDNHLSKSPCEHIDNALRKLLYVSSADILDNRIN